MDFFGNLWIHGPDERAEFSSISMFVHKKEGISWRVSICWSEEQSVPAGISFLLDLSSLEWTDFGLSNQSWAKYLANFAALPSVKAARLSSSAGNVTASNKALMGV